MSGDGRKTLWMMRHGSLPSEYDGRLVGASDVALSEQGCADARAAAGFIAGLGAFDAIWASPKLRVRQTVELALGTTRTDEVEYNPLLRETDFGVWEGLTIAEIAARDPERFREWSGDNMEFSFPGGESMAGFAGRIAAIRDKITDDPGERLLIVAHGGIILALICAFLGLPYSKMVAFKLERGALCRIEIFPGGLGALGTFNVKPGSMKESGI